MTRTKRPAVTHVLAGAALLATTFGTIVNTAAAADLAEVPSGAYVLDPTHAYINFQYNHLGLSNPTLGFDEFSVDLNLDNADPTKSKLLVRIDPSSVITGSDIFHSHLTGADFFDVANHPEIVFQSSSIATSRDGTLEVTGNLTIKNVTRPVTLTVTVNGAMDHPMTGKPVIGIDAAGTVLRSEFGLDKFVPYVGDEVTLDITSELTKAE